MKKVALFSLFAFVLGSFTFAANIQAVTVSTEIVNDNDCDKCGKEDCKKNCTKAEKKACKKGNKKCCKKGAKNGEAGVKAEMEKTATGTATKKKCCKSKKSCSKSKVKAKA